MTNVDLCAFLWDLTTAEPGGTETSVNRGLLQRCRDVMSNMEVSGIGACDVKFPKIQ